MTGHYVAVNRPFFNPVAGIGLRSKGYVFTMQNSKRLLRAPACRSHSSAVCACKRSISAAYAKRYRVPFHNLIINRFYRRCSKAFAVYVILQLVLFFTGAA